ncbi:MAG: ABC transporter substrate-binding protein [Bacilli bacterium]
MKPIVKLLAVTVSLGLAVPTSSCGVVELVQCIGKDQLKIFNWGSYIDPELLQAFEEEYDVCVSYTTYGSNEEAIAKLKSGEVFDIIVPSDYGIEQLVQEDYIQPIDWTRVTSVQPNDEDAETPQLANDLQVVLDKLSAGTEQKTGFDYLTYAVPYFWGSVGIVYDTTTVTLDELEDQQWNIFSNKVPGRDYAYYDTSRDAFTPALKQSGYSINTTTAAEIQEAKQWLINQKQALGSSLSYVVETVIEDMAATTTNGDPANRYDLAYMYSGDAVYAMSENSALSFFKPTVGTDIWVDGMILHKDAPQMDHAYEFINFILRPENAKTNSLYVGYSSPLEAVYTDLLANEFSDYAHAYRIQVGLNDEIYRFDPAAKRLIDDAWVEVKQAQ